MTRADVNRWVSQNAVRVLAYAVASGVAWGLLTAAVRDKANERDVSALRADVVTNQKDAERDRAVMFRLLCRIDQVRDDSSCDGFRR